MSKITILCWQEIPSVVEASDKTGRHKVQLSQRFQELIDLVAMRRGLDGSEAYLMEWRKSKQPERIEPAEEAASLAASEMESRFDEIKSDALGVTR